MVDPGSSSSSLSTGIIVMLVVVPLVVLVLLAILLWRRWKQRVVYQEFAFPPVDEWYLPPEAVEVRKTRELGSGMSGTVYEGRLLKETARFPANSIIAIKMLHDAATYNHKIDFVREAELMKKASTHVHPNILQLVGVAMRTEPLMLMMEFADYGDLHHYIRNNSMRITTLDQIAFARDISRGMAWLTSQNIVHCDLSTRNCLLAAGGVVKVRLIVFFFLCWLFFLFYFFNIVVFHHYVMFCDLCVFCTCVLFVYKTTTPLNQKKKNMYFLKNRSAILD